MILDYLHPIFAAIITAIIEAIRIRLSYGRVRNVNKLWTYTIGFLAFGVCLALTLDYFEDAPFFKVMFYGVYFASCRGLIYDIVLNTFRGLPIDYKSKSTNSIIDMNINVNFYLLRLIYLVLGFVSALIHYNYE